MRLLLPLLLTACAHQAALDRITALEQRLGVLEEALGLSGASQADEQAAAEAFTGAAALAVDDPEAARAALRRVVDAWPRTYGAQAAAELLDKLALIGSVVPAIDGVRWLQGEADLDDARVTLLVFWEVWCPHCQHYVPGLQPVADQYAQQGLQVVTLTRLSRDATEDQVRAFASEHALTFPIGHEDGHMSEALGVSGVPAAAALRGHTVIWRGHPAELDDATLAGWLAAP